MTDNATLSLTSLQKKLTTFRDERNWSQFHTPKNLAAALMVEAAELVEIFQWLTPEQSDNLTPTQRQHTEEELADIFNYLLLICDRLDIELLSASEAKIKKNALKYPVALARGKAEKYTAYEAMDTTIAAEENNAEENS